MDRYDELIHQCDSDIRSGRPQDVKKRLASLEIKRIRRDHRLALAKICRRAGLYNIGIRLLMGVVLSDKPSPGMEVTSAELAEYAVLLLRSGALTEALGKLERVDVQEVPDALLYKAYGHFSRWEYEVAIPHLERYLAADLSPYARLVGRTNLAFALVETRQHEKALKLLGEHLRETGEGGHLQLQSNSYALRAQVYVQEGDFASAKVEIENAQNLITQLQTNDQIFIQKWSLILEGLESKTMGPFEKLRELAIEKRDWEAHREGDLYSLRISPEEERLGHLYFGTPYVEFRKRILDESKKLPANVMYLLGPKSSRCLEIATGRIDGEEISILGNKCHLLIEVLLRDFYKPQRVGGLFFELFPEEQFNVTSSPDRVHQIIRRTRSWIKKAGIPIDVNEDDGFYSLKIKGDFSFLVPLNRPTVSTQAIQLAKLKSFYSPTQHFSAKEAQTRLNVSAATMQRHIVWGVQAGILEPAGVINRNAVYKLKSY